MFNTDGKGHIPYLFGGGFGTYVYPGANDWRAHLDGIFLMDDTFTDDSTNDNFGSQTLIIMTIMVMLEKLSMKPMVVIR